MPSQGASVSGRQPRTAKATAASLARFKTAEERRAYFSQLAAHGNAVRLVLTAEEATALHAAYALLGEIMRRHERASDGDAGAGGQP
jgi:uncharacterized protein with von Willebrand factor type A (vWA) domain